MGNGVSIDLLNFLEKNEKIDLSNLFNNGEKVRWPVDNSIGFLSYKYCPALWRLGARPTNKKNEANKIIEDIITCANVYASLDVKNRPKMDNHIESIYLRAYNELVSYLRYLFIYYNNFITDEHLDDINKWQWSKLLNGLYASERVEKIVVITYNYDIFLERILNKLNIPFDVYIGEETNNKIQIYKPHGSISFIHKTELSLDAFELKNSFDNSDAELNQFNIKYDNLICNPSVIPLIPPAGQASRYSNSWAATIRKSIIQECSKSKSKDVLIFGGLSYWHVDREEIDEIILNVNNELNMYIINPNPPEEFMAVLTTIFKNSIHLPKTDEIELENII